MPFEDPWLVKGLSPPYCDAGWIVLFTGEKMRLAYESNRNHKALDNLLVKAHYP